MANENSWSTGTDWYPYASVDNAKVESGNVVFRNQTEDLIDDFEDGDLNIETSGYSGWYNDTEYAFGSFDARTTTDFVPQGTYAYEQYSSNSNAWTYCDWDGTGQVGFSFWINQSDDTGASNNGSSVGLRDGSGGNGSLLWRIMLEHSSGYIQFHCDDSAANGLKIDLQTYSSYTHYYCEVFWNPSTNEIRHVRIDDTYYFGDWYLKTSPPPTTIRLRYSTTNNDESAYMRFDNPTAYYE